MVGGQVVILSRHRCRGDGGGGVVMVGGLMSRRTGSGIGCYRHQVGGV